MISKGTARRARQGMLREWRLHALSLFSLTVAFICLGASLLVVTNLRVLEERWTHAGRVSIYLKDTTSQEEIEAVQQALSKVPSVLATHYISNAQAHAEFNQYGNHADIASLPDSAFPSSIEVEIKPDMTREELTDIVTKLRHLPSVEDVETYQIWADRLSKLVRGGVTASILLATFVFASVLAVIGSTMRLAFQRRHIEVEVLKLVGATDEFVKGPFILEGSVQGFLGSIGALALLGMLYLIVKSKLDSELLSLIGESPSFLPWYFTLGMIALGFILGALAALTSLRKLVSV